MRDDRERLLDVVEAIDRIEKYENPEDVWAQAAGLRNVIVHEYFGIDHEIVWGIIERDLPGLKQRVQKILAAG